jgi:CBS domain-containing protein
LLDLKGHGVRGLFVRLRVIASDRVDTLGHQFLDQLSGEALLADVMAPDPDTVPPGKTAIEALRLMEMEDGRYRHLPIVENGKVVGIVSRFDYSGI